MVVIALLLLLAFWALLLAFSSELKKHGFKIKPGWFEWHTKRGLKFINNTAETHKRGWRIFGTAAAIVGFALMVLMLVILILNAAFIITRPGAAPPGIVLVIPGLTIPLLEGLVAIFSVLLMHEFSHGFVLRAQDLPIKSVGAMAFIAIPGAFVEPDKERFERARIMQRLRVYGAGSLANILFAMLCLFILLVTVVPLPGVYVWTVSENKDAPAYGVLKPGMRLYSINGVQMNEWADYYYFMQGVSPRDNLTIKTDDDTITLTAAPSPENENRGYLGITPVSAFPRSNFIDPIFTLAMIGYGIRGYPVFNPYCNSTYLPWPVVSVLTWIFLLNFGIGLIQLLPAVPLDGGYILQGVIERASSERTAKRVVRVLSFIVLALILMNFVPYFVRV